MAFPCHSKKDYRLLLIICFGLLFLFGAFRYDFGLDYSAYEDIYNANNKDNYEYDDTERIEFGYLVLNYICPSFRLLLIITSLIVCVSYYFLFDRYIPYKYRFLGILLLYLSGNNTIFFMFSGIRNAVAISLLILSLPLIEKRKLILFLIVMFLASSFHNSAFIFFPIAYLMGLIKEFNTKTATILSLIALGLLVIPFDEMFGNVATFVNLYFDRYDSYLDLVNELEGAASLLLSLPNLILISTIAFQMTKIKLSREMTTIITVGLLSCYFPLLGHLDMRMSICFNAIFVGCFIVAYGHISNKTIKNSLLALTLLYKGYSFFIVFLNNPYFSYQHINNYFFESIIP